MSEPAQSPVSPAVSKRLVTLIAAVAVMQLRRLGLSPEAEAMLFDVVEYGVMAGLGSHWLAPVLRKAIAKVKRDTKKDTAVSDADERL